MLTNLFEAPEVRYTLINFNINLSYKILGPESATQITIKFLLKTLIILLSPSCFLSWSAERLKFESQIMLNDHFS